MKRFIFIIYLCFLGFGLFGCGFGKISEEAAYINGLMTMLGEELNYAQTQSLVAKSPKLDYKLRVTYYFDLTSPSEGLFSGTVLQDQNGHTSNLANLSGEIKGNTIKTYHTRNGVYEYFETDISELEADSRISIQGSMTKESVEYEECKGCEVYKTKPLGTTSAENIYTMFEPALTAFEITKKNLTDNFRKIGIYFYVESGNNWLYQIKFDFLGIANQVLDEDVYGPMQDFYGTISYSKFGEVDIQINNLIRAGAIPALDLFDPPVPKITPNQTEIGSSSIFSVTDAQFDLVSGKLFFIDYDDKKMYSLDTATNELNSLAFPYNPSALFLHGGLVYLALQTSGSSYSEPKTQSGIIYQLSIESLETIKSIDVILDPLDLVVTNDGVIVASSATGRDCLLNSYDVDGKLSFSYYVHPGMKLVYSSSSDRVYGINSYSLDCFTTFSYNAEGKPRETSYQSYEYGTYNLGKSPTISPDGNYLFDSRGKILHAEDDLNFDLAFFENVGSPFTAIAFDLENDRYFLANNGIILEIRSSDHGILSYFEVSSEVDYLYYKDDFLFAIQKTDGEESIIMKYDLH